MYNADTVKGNTFLAFEPLLVAAMIYFVLTFTLSKIVNLIEFNMQNSNKKSISTLSKKSRVKEIA